MDHASGVMQGIIRMQTPLVCVYHVAKAITLLPKVPVPARYVMAVYRLRHLHATVNPRPSNRQWFPPPNRPHHNPLLACRQSTRPPARHRLSGMANAMRETTTALGCTLVLQPGTGAIAACKLVRLAVPIPAARTVSIAVSPLTTNSPPFHLAVPR